MTKEEKQAIIEDARTKHGAVFEVGDEETGLILIRRATKLEARKLKMDRDDETRKIVADEEFAARVIVYPDAQAAQVLLEQFPFLAMSIMNAAFEISGGKKFAAKKV